MVILSPPTWSLYIHRLHEKFTLRPAFFSNELVLQLDSEEAIATSGGDKVQTAQSLQKI
jgi:hypothetical protein